MCPCHKNNCIPIKNIPKDGECCAFYGFFFFTVTKIRRITNNVLILVNGFFFLMTTVCPLIWYLQSSKATLEDIVIIKTWKNKEHVQQQNCCHDTSIHCRVTTIYIEK